MYNYLMLVGEVKEINISTVTTELDVIKTQAFVKLSVRKPFKDMNGNYVYDILPVYCYDFLADMVRDHIKVGNKIGLKGRIINKSGLKIIVDNIIFFDEGVK